MPRYSPYGQILHPRVITSTRYSTLWVTIRPGPKRLAPTHLLYSTAPPPKPCAAPAAVVVGRDRAATTTTTTSLPSPPQFPPVSPAPGMLTVVMLPEGPRNANANANVKTRVAGGESADSGTTILRSQIEDLGMHHAALLHNYGLAGAVELPYVPRWLAASLRKEVSFPLSPLLPFPSSLHPFTAAPPRASLVPYGLDNHWILHFPASHSVS